MGLGAASFLFGAMRSYGKFRGQALGIVLELGGPAALFAAMLGFGMYLNSTERYSGQVYIYEKNIGRPVSASGTLTLQVDDAGPQQFPVTKGHATVTLQRQPRSPVPCDLEMEGYKLDTECIFPGSNRVLLYVIPTDKAPTQGRYEHHGYLGTLFDHLLANVPDSDFSLDLEPTARRDLRDIWIEPAVVGTSWSELFSKICRSYPCLSCLPTAGQITTRVRLGLGAEGVQTLSENPRRLKCGRS